MSWKDIATIKAQHRTGFSNAGWALDAYPDLAELNAHTAITVAEIAGPAVVTCIHMTQAFVFESAGGKSPEERKALGARGVMLEVYYNGESTPAVRSPIGDFFADGCGGRACHYSTAYLEKAPESYNCMIPMPFEKSARIVLRNDTDWDLTNYTFVEYEQMPAWEESLGYFHATWKRFAFQLNSATDQHFFRIDGCGHLLGRAWSICTNEPFFKEYFFVMEGNNEFRIDGEDLPRIDYLGTEDSFGLSWGFRDTYCGQYNGINYLDTQAPTMLSIYRFFGPNVIRFNKSLDLRIDWSHEFTKWPTYSKFVDEINEVYKAGGGWVEYATTYYWYQTTVGYDHGPEMTLEDRIKPMLKS